MMSFRPVAALLALVTLPAMGAEGDVATLRAELQQLKSEYVARVDALEARLQQLESGSQAQSGSQVASAAAALPAPAPPAESPPESPPAPAARGASAFNPAMSMILGGSFTNTARNPADWQIAGFPATGGEVGPGERSFDLGESELTFSASVDPYFSGQATFAIDADDEIEVEEAFVRTSSLPQGFTAKVGRFFSGFGYLNEVHAHAWDFVDEPLVYQALFGGQFRQDGIQVKWLAPSDLFVELGMETGSGAGFPATRLERNGFNGATLFAHVGGDVGDDASWRAGASWLDQRAENRNAGLDGAATEVILDSFSGTSRTWVADAVFKWKPSPRRALQVQAEYLRRTEDGTFLFDPQGLAALTNYQNTQSGWYLQSVYQFAPRWRAGVRYDRLDSGDPRYAPASVEPPLEFAPLAALHPERLSLMLDWNPSEFSRLRAQYDWDDARDDGEPDRIVRLQYIFGIGAHGAHKY